ncbi:LCP family protein [Streptococcus suis]|uniref:LCP family protein n=1 Tax=Streptococcus suis TaxID=1307 RepID=UPI002117E75F|nr:LCP family protein [Streptococcus suis]
MKDRESHLTHHEELRLDYLQKNIHYLNEKEKQELEYLRYKKEIRSRRRGSILSASHSEEKLENLLFGDRESEDDLGSDEFYSDSGRSRRNRGRGENRASNSNRGAVGSSSRKWGLKRIVSLLLLAVSLIFLLIGFNFFKGMNSVSEKPVAEVFNGVDTLNGTNILILGTDGRTGQTTDETRTDTIMVLNVNNSDNKLKLVSFMRDTLVTIGGYDYKINAAYSLGEQNNQQGAENVRQILKENFDIDIKYYAMIDFSTFATTIDTLFPAGVEIDAQFSTIDGETVSSVEVPNDIGFGDQSTPYQTIQVGKQRMNGQTLLNYARYRSDDEGDFGRTRRQQEVLSAVMTQAKNPMKLFSGAEAIGKIIAMTPTTVPQTFMFTQGMGIASDAANGIDRLTIPENGDWIDDYDLYGGMALRIDFEKYQQRLAELGLR